jgi:small subunit ribosomal protein S3
VGNKTHPIGFRLGVIKDWQSHWFVPRGRQYRELVLGDLSIRNAIYSEYSAFSDAGIARIEIERGTQDLIVNIHSARPGILIGRDGERVKKLRSRLERISGRRMQINILEIQQPELNSYLVARNIADQLERRVAHRRALRQAVQRTMQGGAQGVKIIVKGRITGSEIARTEKVMEGRVPLHTLVADIDYDYAEASTMAGRIGVKVWIYKGDIKPQLTVERMEEMETIELTVRADDEDEEQEQIQEQQENKKQESAVENVTAEET